MHEKLQGEGAGSLTPSEPQSLEAVSAWRFIACILVQVGLLMQKTELRKFGYKANCHKWMLFSINSHYIIWDSFWLGKTPQRYFWWGRSQVVVSCRLQDIYSSFPICVALNRFYCWVQACEAAWPHLSPNAWRTPCFNTPAFKNASTKWMVLESKCKLQTLSCICSLGVVSASGKWKSGQFTVHGLL